MLPFAIERLIISGLGKEDSVIEFSSGLTFVVGPSNTGKSHVMDGIDYLFGFSETATNPFRFETDWGYDKFTLVVKTPQGNVILTRKLGEKKIKVTGTDARITQGEYSVSANGANSISSVWLKLIGIDESVQILSSKEGKKQSLTWRGMMHLFFVNQTQIARTSSALLNPKSPTQQTASLASLLYLMTGKDASEVDTPENRQLKRARREAIIAYIDESVRHLGDKIVAMEEEQAAASIPNLDAATVTVQAEIDSVQNEIDMAITESRSLMEKIYAGNSKISEYDTIRSRFDSLQCQYTADMERLAFIADAEAAGTAVPTPHQCPFCNSEIAIDNAEPLFAATLQELAHIKSHLAELRIASSDIDVKRSTLSSEVLRLEDRRREIDQMISSTLSPRISALKEQLRQYTLIAQRAQEIKTIKAEKTRYEADLYTRQRELEETENRPNYDIKAEYGFDIFQMIQEKLSEILKAIQFPGAASARLNSDTFDIEVGGKQKANVMGGGFCEILNSVVLLAIREVLYESGAHTPGILLLDSALTQLSETQYGKNSNVIRDSFIKYLLDHQESGQVIFIDQKEKMPTWLGANSQCKYHEFTKSREQGRYGLLTDVYDEE